MRTPTQVYARVTDEGRREIRPSSPDPLDEPCEAVQGLVERVCAARGGAKALAGTHIPVGYAQIRKWVGDGGLPGLDDLLRLMELAGPDDHFRKDLIDRLQRMFDPTPDDLAAAIVARVESGEPVREAVVNELSFVEVKPGVWARTR